MRTTVAFRINTGGHFVHCDDPVRQTDVTDIQTIMNIRYRDSKSVNAM